MHFFVAKKQNKTGKGQKREETAVEGQAAERQMRGWGLVKGGEEGLS